MGARKVDVYPSELRELIDELAVTVLTDLKLFDAAKAKFAARTQYHVSKRGGPCVEADFDALADPERQAAVVDAQWYRDEIVAASAAITALGTVLQVARPEAVRRA